MRSCLLLAAVTALAAADGPSAAVPSAPVADHRSVAAADALGAQQRAKVRGLRVAFAGPAAGSPVATGLAEMAARDPDQWGIRKELAPSRSWYAKGGVGTYIVGQGNQVGARVEQLPALAERRRFADSIDAVTVQPAVDDLPSGTQIEVPYTQYTATMEVNLSGANVTGVFTEVLNAPRVIGGGGGGGGTVFPPIFPYPIEMPNLALQHVRTQAQVRAGSSDHEPHLSSAAGWSPRDPRRAALEYRGGMEGFAAANPGLAVVYATMPLGRGNNVQRNYYNAAIRKAAAVHGRPLLDIADVLSHDAGDRPCTGPGGEAPADAWLEDNRSSINAAGRERLAKAWWSLAARLERVPASASSASAP